MDVDEVLEPTYKGFYLRQNGATTDSNTADDEMTASRSFQLKQKPELETETETNRNVEKQKDNRNKATSWNTTTATSDETDYFDLQLQLPQIHVWYPTHENALKYRLHT
uniref:Uncharacterized protein n=1 Tax=Bactrocera dorsalis TaxID=27457 RepID=A0A034VFH5_BACDO